MADTTPPKAAWSTEQTFRGYTREQGDTYAQNRRGYHPDLFKIILDYHTSAGGELNTVLDAGCGPGTAVRGLAPHFRHAYGLDASEGMISTARSLGGLTSTPEPIRFEVSSAEELGCQLSPPIANGSIDLITAAAAAHWFDMDAFWPRAAEVLKPGGTVALWAGSSLRVHPSVPNAAAIQEAVTKIVDESLEQYLERGNILSRDLYIDLPLPWTLERPVADFDETTFIRKEWNKGGDCAEGEEFFMGSQTLTLDMFEKSLGTGSPVTRWRQAHPDDVGTDRDIVRVLRKEIERLLHEAGVEPDFKTWFREESMFLTDLYGLLTGMAEVVGLAASITALIEIAGSIAKVCLSYIESIKDYPRDLRRIYLETTYLELLLKSLRFLDEEDDPNDSAAVKVLLRPDGPILNCERVMRELSDLLALSTAPLQRHGVKRQKLNATLTTLAWPLKATKAKKLLDEMMQHKSTINLALTGELVCDVKGLQKGVQKMNQSLTESQKRAICDWFELTNPSSNHNSARSLYEDGTASWVLRCQEWKNWINLQLRAVWLHGIPGAGKTIMMSYLIEEVSRQRCCEVQQKKNVCIYYYCYHGHNQDAAVPFLRWILSQLFRKSGKIPSSAEEIFKEGREPDLPRLVDLLADSMELFDTIFILIDAVDESQNRENLLQLLQTIAIDPRLKRIQLLASSRDYVDIRRVMTICSAPLSLSNPLVESDINLFVSKMISRNEKFRRWPDSLRTEVEQKLSVGAKGMFRWAVCQLDILRRLHHVDKIKTALQSLPETLDETYVRIFSYIHPEERQLVRHALRWICFHDIIWEDPIEAFLLLDVYPLSTGEEQDEAKSLFTVESLKESCGCLVTFGPTPDSVNDALPPETAFLAHYTVREFLESTRAKGVALDFRLRPDDNYYDLFEAVLIHASTGNPQEVVREASRLSTRRSRVYCLAISFLVLFERNLDDKLRHANRQLINPDLVYQFLNPFSPHIKTFRAEATSNLSEIRYMQVYGNHISVLLDWDWECFEGPAIAGTFIMLMILKEYDLAENYLQICGTRAILEAEVAISRPAGKIPKTDNHWFRGSVLEYCATLVYSCGDVDGGPFEFCCKNGFGHVDFSNILSYYAVTHLRTCECQSADVEKGEGCLMEKLLAKGAQPNPPGFLVTPMQICCFVYDTRGVRILLDAGADPNDTGQKDGCSWAFTMANSEKLQGCSPLRILKDIWKENYARYSMDGPGMAKVHDMISLLERHGARDFSHHDD